MPIEIDAKQTKSKSSDPPLHYFNNAGASPSPDQVVDTIVDHLKLECREGGYNAANIISNRLDDVYNQVVRLINAKYTDEIALVESATVAWTKIFYSLVDCILERGLKLVKETETSTQSAMPIQRIILISHAEYAANVAAIIKWSREQNSRHKDIIWKVFAIPSTSRLTDDGSRLSTGMVDVDFFRKLLLGTSHLYEYQDLCKTDTCTKILPPSYYEDKQKVNPNDIVLVCITHIPTNSGIVNPVNAIGREIHLFNERRSNVDNLPSILYLVDACQSIGHIQVDVQSMFCHALAATGRKYLRGPRGTGFLYVNMNVVNCINPIAVDHFAAPVTFEMITTNGKEDVVIDVNPRKGAKRFEYWESNISTRLGLGAAITYCLDEIGMQIIEKRIFSLGRKLREGLRTLDFVQIFHDNLWNGEEKYLLCGIVTFSIDGKELSNVKELMLCSNHDGSKSELSHRFETSIVPSTSTPLDSGIMHAKELLRVSLSYFNSEAEIYLFLKKLQFVVCSSNKSFKL